MSAQETTDMYALRELVGGALIMLPSRAPDFRKPALTKIRRKRRPSVNRRCDERANLMKAA